MSPGPREGASAASAAAVCLLLIAGVLAGAALAAPGSRLGVRTEGAATTVATTVGPGADDAVRHTSSRISRRYTTENSAPTSSNSSATAVP
ncbi:hypothetical protein GA0115260_1068014 [Streptomyces sp. MnatMP-M27]|nr:hypothetical protein GA0115260_1068014 [Streptomyces sp. MnatMP-M27]